MKSQRLKYTIINSTILTLIQVFTIVLKFITQTVFIKTLGKTYLGLNGLFTNVLSVLSFAELGIGTAIVFSLYEPLANKDTKKIAALMQLFKKAYYFIGIVVGLSGIILIPFLHLLIKNFSDLHNVYYYFILYLSNSVVSYFFSYKRSLLIADQHEYVSTLNIFLFLLIQTIIQIPILIYFQAYSFYLWTAIFCTLVSNVFISKKVDEKYSYLKQFDTNKNKVDKNLMNTIKRNVIGMMGSKIGSIAVRSTDNLLISMFLGIAIVGLYSNYLLIVTSISTILIKLTSSMTASIGNLAIEENGQRSYEVFKIHFMINLFLVSVTSGCLLVSINPFITFWAGKNYLLETNIMIIVVLNYFIDQLRQTSITFISAYGLFVQNGRKSIVEAILNLILSIFFMKVFNLGIGGTLLGTICTNLILNSWWEPYLLLKSAFNLRLNFFNFYFKLYIKNAIVFLVAVLASYKLIMLLDDYMNFGFLFSAIINSLSMIFLLGVFIMLFYRNDGSIKYLKRIFKLRKSNS